MVSELGGFREASKSVGSELENFKKFSMSLEWSELPFLIWNGHFLCDFGFLSLMAIAMSFGKRSCSTKARKIVVTRRAVTTSVAVRESMTDRAWVTTLVISLEYLIVATAAPVMGKV